MYIDKPPIEDFLIHYGKGHLDGGHSGRYPWGSGDKPYQTSGDFYSRYRQLKKEGFNSYYDANTGITYTGERAIAAAMGMFVKDKDGNIVPSTNELRRATTLAKNQERMAQVNRAEYLRSQGYGNSEIGRKMGISESTVRGLLDPISKENMMQARVTADYLKDELEKKLEEDPKAMIDIGKGVERDLGITRTKLDDAIYILEGEGYVTSGGRIPQLTDPTGAHQTTQNVLGGPDMQPKDAYDFEHIYSLKDYISRDNGQSYEKRFEYPESMDSKRLEIRYKEDGGIDKDGVIEIRRGVDDLSLGEKNYAQVRILVDGDKYLKGMAVYGKDKDFPDGVDVIFNTNKSKDVPMEKVLKDIKDDPDNPFGSLIKDAKEGGQYKYIGKDGKEHLGLINKKSDEGDWNEWQDTLSAQFLSKQPIKLAERQLNIAVEDKRQEFNDILKLNNDTVKQYYLESFANDCDSAAIHLKAAALPRQKYQVILPITSMKDDEVYAPNFNNGEKLALIRYPHGGTFEIPILTVNNKQAEGIRVIGKNSQDAIGINAKVANQLSGADFDGDTVMVIPVTSKTNISARNPLKELEGFDPKTRYATKEVIGKDGEKHYYNSSGKEIKVMNNTQIQMGKISNLITDMTIKGASDDEIARAVKHSMVVIDAEKHKLDYDSSYQENDIDGLKKKWQKGTISEKTGRETYGASTLISRAKSEADVDKRQGQPKINIKGTPQYDPDRPEGALIFKKNENAINYKAKVQITDPETGKIKNKKVAVYPDKDGNFIYISSKTKDANGKVINNYKVLPKDTPIESNAKTQKSTKMAEVDDARKLISDYNTPIEQVYASYANSMKALANEARKVLYFTKGAERNPNATKTYKKEVDSLNSKLDIAEKNKPRERQAERIARSRYTEQIKSNPGMSKEEQKKLRQRELTRARDQVGARRETIEITDKEWEAIQANAIASNKLKSILTYADMDKVKERATPREYKTMNDAQIARAKAMAASGRTNAEIAAALGVSASTVSNYVNG